MKSIKTDSSYNRLSRQPRCVTCSYGDCSGFCLLSKWCSSFPLFYVVQYIKNKITPTSIFLKIFFNKLEAKRPTINKANRIAFMSISFLFPTRCFDSSFKHEYALCVKGKQTQHQTESHKVNRCLPSGAASATQYDWRWSDVHNGETRKMCPLETEQKKMSFSHCRKHLAEREKVTWKKPILHLRGWCSACKVFFFYHYIGRKCTKGLIRRPTNLSKTSRKMTRAEDESWENGTWHVNLKTGAGNEITAKDSGWDEAREGCLGAAEAGVLLWLHLHLERLQAQPSDTDHLQEPPVTLCICVRQPQQRGPLLLLTGVKPNLDGDMSMAISSLIAFYVS